MVSAASYTLVGVVNKFLTVLLNCLIWEKHSSSMLGIISVCICLLGGTFYQQAPKRDEVRKEGGGVLADVSGGLFKKESV